MTSENITIVSIIAITTLECYAMYQNKMDVATFLGIVTLIAVMGGYHAGKITGVNQLADHVGETAEVLNRVDQNVPRKLE